jgi:hypothetical protein
VANVVLRYATTQSSYSYRDVTVVPTIFVRMLGKLLDACI